MLARLSALFLGIFARVNAVAVGVHYLTSPSPAAPRPRTIAHRLPSCSRIAPSPKDTAYCLTSYTRGPPSRVGLGIGAGLGIKAGLRMMAGLGMEAGLGMGTGHRAQGRPSAKLSN